MIEITSDKIITPELADEAILHKGEVEGFELDYLVLHCLLRIYKPKRFCEIGTHLGVGTKIIKNALGEDSEVFSLDLPIELAHVSKQHPKSEGKIESVGSQCDLPFTQLYGDSLVFNFSKIYPIDGFWIDAEHDWVHVNNEAKEAIKSRAKLIAFHDADEPEVYNAIVDAFRDNEDYELTRVVDTRILFAIKK